jgi:hypothetical protein
MIQRYSDRTVEQLLSQLQTSQYDTFAAVSLPTRRKERQTITPDGKPPTSVKALKTNHLLTHADALQVKAYSNGGS